MQRLGARPGPGGRAAGRAARASEKAHAAGHERALKGDLAIFLAAFLEDETGSPMGPAEPTGDRAYGDSSLAPAPAESELKRSTLEELRGGIGGGEQNERIVTPNEQDRASHFGKRAARA